MAYLKTGVLVAKMRIKIYSGFQCDCSSETVFASEFSKPTVAVEFIKSFLFTDIVKSVWEITIGMKEGSKKRRSLADALRKIIKKTGAEHKITIDKEFVTVSFGEGLKTSGVKNLYVIGDMLNAILKAINEVKTLIITVAYLWGKDCGTHIALEREGDVFSVSVSNQDIYSSYNNAIEETAKSVMMEVGGW